MTIDSIALVVLNLEIIALTYFQLKWATNMSAWQRLQDYQIKLLMERLDAEKNLINIFRSSKE